MHARTCKKTPLRDHSSRVFASVASWPHCVAMKAQVYGTHRLLTSELPPQFLVCYQQRPLEGQRCLACATSWSQRVHPHRGAAVAHAHPITRTRSCQVSDDGAQHALGCQVPVQRLAWQAGRVHGSAAQLTSTPLWSLSPLHAAGTDWEGARLLAWAALHGRAQLMCSAVPRGCYALARKRR